MRSEDEYAKARMELDSAMEDFVRAAQSMGASNLDIANDVCDSLFNGSDGEIKVNVTLEENDEC